MDKLLIICGPTATGKTNLALQIAAIFPADLISADSRQVYNGADIVTGKDVPSDFAKTKDKYTNGQTNIYGLDLVEPDFIYNVSDWKKYAQEKIDFIQQQERLPIVVGGTGLYIKSLTHDMQTLDVPPDLSLRMQLQQYSADQLYEKLFVTNKDKALSLNQSDRKNPRRLIRAIEVAGQIAPSSVPLYDTLNIGLTCSLEIAKDRISKRVEDRINSGAPTEYADLINRGYVDIGRIASGYKYINDPQLWAKSELQQFRRQVTWFKKMPDINWFDTNNPNWQSTVIAKVGQWYSTIKSA